MGRRSNNLNQLMINEQLLQKRLSRLRTELDGMYEDVSKAKSEINDVVNDIMELLALRREELLKKVDKAFKVKMVSVNSSMTTTAIALGKLQIARMNNIDSADMVHATTLMEELQIVDNLESGNEQPKVKVALPVDELREYVMSWGNVGEEASESAEEEDNEFELDAEFVHFDEADDSSSSVGILPSFDEVSCRAGDNNRHIFVKPECCKMQDNKVQIGEWLALMKTRKVSEVCMPKSNEPYSEYLRNPVTRSSQSCKRPCTSYSSRSDGQEWLKPRRRPSVNQSGVKALAAIRGRPLEFPCLRPDSDVWVRKSARKTQVGELRYSNSKLIPAHYTLPHSFWIKPLSLKKSLS